MFKLIKENTQYNNNTIITITYNNQTVFYKGFELIGEREIQLIKDQAFNDLLRVLNTGAIPASMFSDLMNTINTLAPEHTLEQVLNALDNNEYITVKDLNNYRDTLKENYEYYAHYENDLSCEDIFLFHSIDDINYFIDNQYRYWDDNKEQFNYYYYKI